LLETQTLRHGDNTKLGAEQFFAVVVVTPQKLESKAVKTLIDKIEAEFIDDDSWNIIDYVNLVDNETKTNFANFTVSKVFGK
jgi:predicted metal-dependent TIM-barrel fold hydrolase